MDNHDFLSDDEVIVSDVANIHGATPDYLYKPGRQYSCSAINSCSLNPTNNNNRKSKPSEPDENGHSNSNSDFASILRAADRSDQPKRALSSTRYEEWKRECDRAEIGNHAKTVRFADSMGFDLEVTKLYTDELPNVPPEAYYYLSLSSSRELTPPDPRDVAWTALFSQPYTTPYFHRNLLQNKVQLDHAFIHNMEISVTVRVVNLSYEKGVFLRYTQNSWHTTCEKQTKHLRHIPQHNVDVFCVKAPLAELSMRVEFAIRYVCMNQEFWDNNGNLNYIFVQENRGGYSEQEKR